MALSPMDASCIACIVKAVPKASTNTSVIVMMVFQHFDREDLFLKRIPKKDKIVAKYIVVIYSYPHNILTKTETNKAITQNKTCFSELRSFS